MAKLAKKCFLRKFQKIIDPMKTMKSHDYKIKKCSNIYILHNLQNLTKWLHISSLITYLLTKVNTRDPIGSNKRLEKQLVVVFNIYISMYSKLNYEFNIELSNVLLSEWKS